jgi:regulator of replication initiation timing
LQNRHSIAKQRRCPAEEVLQNDFRLFKDVKMNRERSRRSLSIILVLTVFPGAGIVRGQQSDAHPNSTPVDGYAGKMEQRMDQLMNALDSMRHQLDQSQHEMEQMRAELQELRAQLAESHAGEEPAPAAAALQASVQQLQEQTDVLHAEVKQHDQTKLESVSKYPVRISGMLLFTSFLNSGNVDNIDLPIIAEPRYANQPVGSLGATARQTILGIEATGPSLWGARSSADISVDFFGGIAYADYSTSAGLLRMRTARANLDWSHRSLAAVLDSPLVSPLQPTSFLSVGEPALAWSGNLWTWSPQIEFKDNSLLSNRKLGIEAGLIDVPAPGPPPSNALRVAGPSEQSMQPGYETRLSSALPFEDRTIEIGAGGYYSRQAYEDGHHLDAWAGTVDWRIPFTRRLELSGEFYRGRGIGGLGGGAFKDYVPFADDTIQRGLNAEGGWGQFKVKMTRSLEANFAIGEDNAFAGDLRGSDLEFEKNDYLNLARNRTGFANVIFRPKTYLLFSAEYRNIYTWPIAGQSNSNQSLGLAAGYLF